MPVSAIVTISMFAAAVAVGERAEDERADDVSGEVQDDRELQRVEGRLRRAPGLQGDATLDERHVDVEDVVEGEEEARPEDPDEEERERPDVDPVETGEDRGRGVPSACAGVGVAREARALLLLGVRRPLSMKEGGLSSGSGSVGHGPRVSRGVRAGLNSLSPPRGRTRWYGSSLRWRISVRAVYAARAGVAPAGAKGWLRVSMCQIASARRRAMSTWATLAPRCLPSRALLRW